MTIALHFPTTVHDARLRRTVGMLPPVLLVVFLLASCGDDSTSGSGSPTSTTGAPTTTDAATTTTVAPTTEPEPPEPGTCDPDEIDALLRPMLGSADGPEIDRVDITDCAGGYARVIVVPVETNFESEQVFVRQGDDGWEVVDFGTGISCKDDDLGAKLTATCDALGLG